MTLFEKVNNVLSGIPKQNREFVLSYIMGYLETHMNTNNTDVVSRELIEKSIEKAELYSKTL